MAFLIVVITGGLVFMAVVKTANGIYTKSARSAHNYVTQQICMITADAAAKEGGKKEGEENV